VLAVAVKIVNIGYSDFENTVFIILIMLYIATSNFAGIYGRVTAELNLKQNRQFIYLAKLLKDPNSVDLEETLQEESNKLKKSEIKFWINAIGMAIIDIYLTLKLLSILGIF
jgi:hypothetical protein